MSHARCEALTDRLTHDVLRAAPYHAGMTRTARADVQDRFFAGDLDVVVATSAFGMGIDKPDIRTVIHAGIPSSVDDYYQEIGRAGRDGSPAAAVLVYDERTLRIPRLLAARSRIGAAATHAVIDALEERSAEGQTLTDVATRSRQSVRTVERIALELSDAGAVTLGADGKVTVHSQLTTDTARRLHDAGERHQLILRSQLDAIRHYAETAGCRRAELLAYFGEQYPPPCGHCDNDAAHTNDKPPGATATVSPYGPTPPTETTRVVHTLWGPGTLLARDQHELIIAFDSVGYRHLSPRALDNGLLTICPPTPHPS
jgi:ATP-dependent DNA helicase RecQ